MIAFAAVYIEHYALAADYVAKILTVIARRRIVLAIPRSPLPRADEVIQ